MIIYFIHLSNLTIYRPTLNTVINMALIKKKLCLLAKDQEDGILALVKGHISSYPTLDLTLFYKDLCTNFPDRWICALGSSFSYNISRASKGICIIGIQYSPTDIVNLLIYSPPYTELSSLGKLHYELGNY